MSCGTADGDRPAEIAFAELANRAVDLPHRPADEQQEQADEDERARNQRGRQPRELLLRRARVLLQRFEPVVDRDAHAVGDGARRVGQHAEALDDRVAGAVRRAGAQHAVHVLRHRREPRELLANRSRRSAASRSAAMLFSKAA